MKKVLVVAADPVLREALEEQFESLQELQEFQELQVCCVGDLPHARERLADGDRWAVIVDHDPPHLRARPALKALHVSEALILGEHLPKPFRFAQILSYLRTQKHPSSVKGLSLTARESALYACLRAHRPTPVSRATLLQEVWGYAEDVETHTLETHIHGLRRKLKALFPDRALIVRTKQGYSWRGP